MLHDASAAANHDQRPGWMHTLQSSPSMRMLLGFGAFVLAVMMLAGFYVVIQEGVARANSQWAKASRVIVACDVAGRTNGANCLASKASTKVGQVSSVR